MKITKEMGRACLRELETGDLQDGATDAIEEMIFGNHGSTCTEPYFQTEAHYYNALAMCAAIAGVSHAD